MRRFLTLSFVALFLTWISASSVIAHGGATGVVKQRMDSMEMMGTAMKSLARMILGQEPYDVDRVRTMAQTLESHSGEALTTLFPEGSLQPPSEASPDIWTDWQGFEDLAEQLSKYSKALEMAAGNERMMGGGAGMMGGGMRMGADATGASVEELAQLPPDMLFRQLTQTCSACHRDFREER